MRGARRSHCCDPRARHWAVARFDPHQPFARIHGDGIAGAQGPGDVHVEPVDERQLRERRALHHDGIGAVEQQRRRRHPARAHLAQHPRGGDTALGGVERQDPPDVALAVQRVGRAGENTPDAVEIVAGAEVVRGGQHDPRHLPADASGRGARGRRGPRRPSVPPPHRRLHVRLQGGDDPLPRAGVAAELAAGAVPGAHQYRPRTAASTHASMGAMTGAYPYPWMMLTSLAELVRSRRQPLIRPISRARIW